MRKCGSHEVHVSLMESFTVCTLAKMADPRSTVRTFATTTRALKRKARRMMDTSSRYL